MSRCKNIQKELEAFLSDETDKAKISEIQDHLKECQKCSQALKESTRLSEVLQTWQAIDPPPHLYEKLRTQIKSADFYHQKIILNPFVKKVAFEFAKVAAVVIVTLLIGY
jgi:predicted anti-sigma-YlaC factor YlaD